MPFDFSQLAPLLCTVGGMVAVFAFIAVFSDSANLNGIKSRQVGDVQHGTARWATKKEMEKAYLHLPFLPEQWRKGEKRPKEQGLVVGSVVGGLPWKQKTTALIDTGDVHCLMIGASGVGKTAHYLYPNLEYACASGVSFLASDTKGDVYRNYVTVARECYGYQVSVIELRNPTRSDGANMLHLISKYADQYHAHPDDLRARAKMEKYAKICAKTIIQAGGEQNYGQNAYFYDAAEGLLASVMMLIAEFCPPKERHIVSVFKLLQDLLAPSKVKGKNHLQLLMEQLPPEHKARWMAGAALHTGEQAMLSVLSTAMSRLNAFLDTELEQLLCFDSAIDAERFCGGKTALFIVMPEEDPTAYFLVSLIIQQLYRELMTVADENGGKLPRRCIFYCDEFGTIPKLEGAEMLFSAARSRRLSIVAIVQGLIQLDKNYGREGAQVIRDNCQLTIFGGFAPGSETAETLSKDLGEQTVLSGSVSKGKDNHSRSLQMMGRRLMTPDELKSMPKGQFITMKTGMHPMKTKFALFLRWGIRFGKQFELPEHSARKIQYAGREKLAAAIAYRYPKAKPKQEIAPAAELAGEPVQESLEKPPHRRPPRTD